jgi:hypothetical protein
MSDVADHPDVRREFPVIAQSLQRNDARPGSEHAPLDARRTDDCHSILSASFRNSGDGRGAQCHQSVSESHPKRSRILSAASSAAQRGESLWYRGGMLHLSAQEGVPTPHPSSPRDATQKSPGAKWFSRERPTSTSSRPKRRRRDRRAPVDECQRGLRKPNEDAASVLSRRSGRLREQL